MRLQLSDDPYEKGPEPNWGKRGVWRAQWVAHPNLPETPFVTAYRLKFHLPQDETIRFHVTADERYLLFLDGDQIGRGSERGDALHWFYETCEVPLKAGDHLMLAKVWSLGEGAAFAQMSLFPGFLLSPQEERFFPLLATGEAPWEAILLSGYEFIDPISAWGTGKNLFLRGEAMNWEAEKGLGEGWLPVKLLDHGANAKTRNETAPTHMLLPGILPPMLERETLTGAIRHVSTLESLETHAIPVRSSDNIAIEAEAWGNLIKGNSPLVIPPHTKRRVIWDLQNYYCAYPDIVVSRGAGAAVRIHWQESLYEKHGEPHKGDRDEIEGKYFLTVWHYTDGVGDTFHPDGGANRRFTTLWWQAGRYVEICIETKSQELCIESLKLRETRYPLELESRFDTSDPELGDITPIAFRALQMCSHETYMDCPFYEQLMYVGDTRLEALTTYMVTHDSRLPCKALQMFDASRLLSGLTQSRYPSRVRQIIPPFSLWWVAMVRDYLLYRGEPDFIATLMPGVRGVMDYFLSLRNSEGLVKAPNGWNYMDWAPEWNSGVPPDGLDGVSGVINWQFAYVLRMVSELEGWFGEGELQQRSDRLSKEVASAIHAAFWDESSGMYADDQGKKHYSEHAQCLAILSGLPKAKTLERVTLGLLSAQDLTRTTIYFSHYLLETFYAINRPDRLLNRLDQWKALKKFGLKTTIEHPEPSRSDCHAWGAHPIFHFHSSLLGIRPESPGFARVRIAPQMGSLEWMSGSIPHPKGEILVDLRKQGFELNANISLPKEVSGVFIYNGKKYDLSDGLTKLCVK